MRAKKMFFLIALICAVSCFWLPAVAQTTGSFVAPATNVIFAAGGNADPADFQGVGSLSLTYPTDIPLPVGTVSVTFSNVHGRVSCCGQNSSTLNGPDGSSTEGYTNLTSVNSISGIRDTKVVMFLAGVFVEGTPSGAAPPTMTFDNGLPFYGLPTLQNLQPQPVN